jgi:hypothetical protein
VSAATAPTAGQVLTASNSTTAAWVTPTAGAATNITPGTTTIIGATAPCLIRNSATTVMDCLAIASGNSTALGVTTGSAGAPVLFNGAGGTPSSLTLTSATGLPISTGLTGAGTGVITALGVNTGSAGAFTKNNGDALSGTFTGSPTFSGATLTFSGATPLFTGLSAGTQVSCLGLDSGNHVVLNAAACGSGGGATGVGVQGGQSVSNVGDNTTALPSGHFYYATNASMTAQRTHALPDSATQGVGDFMVMDTQQTVTNTNQLCMSRAGSDTINGGTTAVCITTAGGSMLFHNNGAGAYTTGPNATVPAPTDGQILIGKTGTPQNVIAAATMSGDCTITNAGVITCSLANSHVLGVTTGSGTTHTMGGANGPREYWFCTGTCTVTMPVPAAGQEYCVATNVGVTAAITLAAIGSSAMYGKTDQSAYGTAGTGTAVSTSASANKICLVGLDSTHFNVASYNGTWTMN